MTSDADKLNVRSIEYDHYSPHLHLVSDDDLPTGGRPLPTCAQRRVDQGC